MHNFHIDFMGNKRIMFALSITLIVISIGALAIRGLQFGVEFTGGTVVNVVNAQDVTIDQMRKAFTDAGVKNPQVQESTVPTLATGTIWVSGSYVTGSYSTTGT